MNASPKTTGRGDRFIDTIFSARAFGIADTGAGTTPQGCSASAAFQRLGCRVIGTATAKTDIFAITINGDTIGGSWVLIWSAAHRKGKTGRELANAWEKYHGR
jgi:hypothetical protein